MFSFHLEQVTSLNNRRLFNEEIGFVQDQATFFAELIHHAVSNGELQLYVHHNLF